MHEKLFIENDQKPTHPAWLSNPTISKFCHPSYMVIIPHNFKILLSLLWLSHFQNFKILLLLQMEFFWIGNPTYICLEKGINYVSIIITIVSNIAVLVSHSVIFFGYFMSLSHGINKKTPPSASYHPSLTNYLVFIRFVCCFAIDSSSTLFCSYQINAKDNAISK